jgi:hypothetical protein
VKKSLRYIAHRPGKDDIQMYRELFGHDGVRGPIRKPGMMAAKPVKGNKSGLSRCCPSRRFCSCRMRRSSALAATCRPFRGSGSTGAAFRTLEPGNRSQLLRFRSCQSLRRHNSPRTRCNRSRRLLPISVRMDYDSLSSCLFISRSKRFAMVFPNLARAAATFSGRGGRFFISAAVVSGCFPDLDDFAEFA